MRLRSGILKGGELTRSTDSVEATLNLVDRLLKNEERSIAWYWAGTLIIFDTQIM